MRPYGENASHSTKPRQATINSMYHQPNAAETSACAHCSQCSLASGKKTVNAPRMPMETDELKNTKRFKRRGERLG
ncbi:hypothetical protein D3C81_627730 [compost metagenome]